MMAGLPGEKVHRLAQAMAWAGSDIGSVELEVLCTSQCYSLFGLWKDWLEMATETISIFLQPT